jgi:hypothetical protein
MLLQIQIRKMCLNKPAASVAPQMADGIKRSMRLRKLKVIVAIIANDRTGTPRSSIFFFLFHLGSDEVRVPDDAYLDAASQYGFTVDF